MARILNWMMTDEDVDGKGRFWAQRLRDARSTVWLQTPRLQGCIQYSHQMVMELVANRTAKEGITISCVCPFIPVTSCNTPYKYHYF